MNGIMNRKIDDRRWFDAQIAGKEEKFPPYIADVGRGILACS